MANWGSIANAAGMAVSGYAKDKERIRAEALQAQQAERQARQDAILQAVEARRVASPITIRENWAKAMGGDQDAVGAVVSAEPTLADNFQMPDRTVPPPQVVSPGQGIRQPDGTYKVPVPATPPAPKEPAMVWAASPDGKGGPVRTLDKPGVEGPGPTTGVLRAPTEAQEKSYVFYNLMKTAAPELERLSLTGKVRPDAITLALRAGPLDFVANRLLNAEEKQYLKAARDMTAGVLRKESGAAIKNDEILNTMQRMIDMSGDDEPLKLAKTKSRNEYMSVMENAATPALRYYEAIKANGAQKIDPATEAADPGGGGLPPAGGGAPKAANERQALWDAAVAKHGQAKVIATYGPRP